MVAMDTRYCMHGAGPGTSAAGNFAKVKTLAKRYEVYGTDMIGFDSPIAR